MPDTLKRLAGPTAPIQKNAGSSIYTPASGVTAAVKSMLVTNTDPIFGAFLWTGINDLTVAGNRFHNAMYIPAGETLYLPFDMVLTSSDTFMARQGCMVEPTLLTWAAILNSDVIGASNTITSSSWTPTTNNTPVLLAVAQRHAATVGTITSITDTHTGLTWTLIASLTDGATMRLSVYRGIVTTAGSTTTTVAFSQQEAGSAVIGYKLTDTLAGTASPLLSTTGTHADDVFQSRGSGYIAPTNTAPIMMMDDVSMNTMVIHNGEAQSHTQTAMTGWTELIDLSSATSVMTTTGEYMMAPASWSRPTIATGSADRLFVNVEVMNTKRSLNITLNGVEHT